MLRALRRIWRPSLSDNLANAFSRLGWAGLWIQINHEKEKTKYAAIHLHSMARAADQVQTCITGFFGSLNEQLLAARREYARKNQARHRPPARLR